MLRKSHVCRASTSPILKKKSSQSWSVRNAERAYGFKRWGGNHFSVDDDGFLCAHPAGDARSIRLLDIIAEAKGRGLNAPLVIRLQDLLRQRVVQLNEAFRDAVREEGYSGVYRGVFPVKVNQMREVVEEILDAGKPYGYGLEAGSKPELMLALAQLDDKNALLVCNGYKDDDYIRLALMGRKLGKNVVIVIEQRSEVEAIARLARELDVKPVIGVRVKLRTGGEGKWASSTGEDAKFGLTADEILSVTDFLRRENLEDALQLVHFHIGSQVPNILPIKKAVVEATRFYCELAKMGFPMRYLDVGGGLGVDYDGSRTNYESSMNYALEEYARDIVANIKLECDKARVHAPDIVSESGRAIVAPHSLLVLEVVDRIVKPCGTATPCVAANEHSVIGELRDILRNAEHLAPLERFHDAQQRKEEAQSLFTLGYLDLKTRALAENLFWEICRDIKRTAAKKGYVPDELEQLEITLAEQYVCNFSVFQSLLDHWALDQLFPIMPLHRLNERPSVEAILVDITCDSDGKINEFVDLEDMRRTLALHPLKKNEPYYLGVFLVGAYQDIMGDLHNLFGRVDEVHVFLEEDEEDGFYLEETIRGERVRDVVEKIQWEGSELARVMKRQIDRATKNDLVKPREGVHLLDFYEDLLDKRTYLRTARKQKRKHP